MCVFCVKNRAELTLVALTSIDKFILYGLVTKDVIASSPDYA